MSYRKIAELSTLALSLPSSIAVGLFAGYFLDRWLGTEPWMLCILTLLGIVSGLLTLVRGISKIKDSDISDE